MKEPKIDLRLGDCLDLLKTLEENSVDAIVTDPPGGIDFMGQEWDGDKGGRDQWIAWMQEVAAECLRVLKPGGHAFVWAMPRTSHWTAMAWENGGFEVREKVAHVFGSGFPKSMDVGKQMDKMAGAERKVIGSKLGQPGYSKTNAENQGTSLGWSKSERNGEKECEITAPATPEAEEWDGWGTALKPAMEDWWLFRKPISEKTVAANVLRWGTGALNIDACRVPGEQTPINKLKKWSGFGQEVRPEYEQEMNDKGRWPANFIHDGSEEVLQYFPEASGQQYSTGPKYGKKYSKGIFGDYGPNTQADPRDEKNKSAARFFYCAKPDGQERDEGLDGIEQSRKSVEYRPNDDGSNGIQSRLHGASSRKNPHPTVKPLALMKYLITLITPPDGVVLDPFMGSGTTGRAALELGFSFIGFEKEKDYFPIAEKRVRHGLLQPKLL
jgi:DNA modification methylase